MITDMINEKTLIPLSMVIIIVGIAIKFTIIESKTEANDKKIEKVEIRQSDYAKDLGEVNKHLSRIEGALDIK